MRTAATIACLSLTAALAACGPQEGYYDAQGNYHPAYYNNAPVPGGDPYAYDYAPAPVTTTTTTYTYSRPGYYDYNGYYIGYDNGPRVPSGFLPPRGMCRVWFTDRDERYQPSVEPCANIRYRVPAGAYIIYGG